MKHKMKRKILSLIVGIAFAMAAIGFVAVSSARSTHADTGSNAAISQPAFSIPAVAPALIGDSPGDNPVEMGSGSKHKHEDGKECEKCKKKCWKKCKKCGKRHCKKCGGNGSDSKAPPPPAEDTE